MESDKYLKSTYFIDTESDIVKEFVKKHIRGSESNLEKSVKLYYAVRDKVKYNPYCLSFNKEHFKASYCLGIMEGFCIQKAILLTAVTRAAGIPSRLVFVNVVNHLSTGNLRNILKTDVFVFHGCTDMYINNSWVKATPAFNSSLCEKFGVHPLEFDGKSDSLFHPYDKEGRKHMEYIHDYGSFEDFPLEMMISEMKKYYSHLFEQEDVKEAFPIGDFEKEAIMEN